ncbi:MAG: serine protease [Patescibacteria group bacterium]
MSISSSYLAAFCLFICLPACAFRQHGPEVFKIQENRQATYRLDSPFNGHGSGVVVSREGHVLTAAHVAVAGDLEITIEEGGGIIQTYPAELISLDPDHDLAVVKIDRHFDHPAVLEDPAVVHPGDEVYNVGYPYSFGEMVGRGYVQKLDYGLTKDDGTVVIQDAILVDMPDGPGTSGSGIFLARSGKLIGVMSMAFWMSNGDIPPTVTRVLASVEYARKLLESSGVQYLTSADAPRDGEVLAYDTDLKITVQAAPLAKH